MTTQELLPCPFCGEPPRVDYNGGHVQGTDDYDEKFTVSCVNTHGIPACPVRPETWAYNEADAYSSWNTRSAKTLGREELAELMRKAWMASGAPTFSAANWIYIADAVISAIQKADS